MNENELIAKFDTLKENENYVKILIKNINELEVNEAEKVYKKLNKYVKNNGLNIAYPWVMNSQGWIYYDLNKVDKCIELNEKALKRFQHQKNIEGVLSTINALVVSYSVKKEYEKAVKLGIKGINLGEENKDYQRVYTIKNNIAFMYIGMQDYKNARDVLEQLLEISKLIKPYNLVILYMNIAECDRNLGNPKRALELLKESEKICRENNFQILPEILEYMGRTYTVLGEYNLADQCFKSSNLYSDDGREKAYSDETLIWWAALDYKREKYEEAIEKLRKAELIENYRESERDNKMLYDLLHKSYNAIGDFQQAYKYFEKFYKVDSEIRDNRESNYVKRLNKKLQADDNKVYKILYNKTKSLYSLGLKLTSNLNKEHIYKVIGEEIVKIVKADVIQLGIVKNHILEYRLIIKGEEKIEIDPISLDADLLATYSINNKQQLLIGDLRNEYVDYLKNIESFDKYLEIASQGNLNMSENIPQSAIFVPIIRDNIAIGIISTQCYEENTYTLEDVVSLQILSTYLAIALENIKLYEEIEYNSKYDSLTKILNRGSVLSLIQEKYNNILNNKEQWYLLMIDIDNFKKINDTYGHQIGDDVLIEISQTIADSINHTDIFGRYGGEEIIALINNGVEDYLQVAERIRKNIEERKVKAKDGTNIKVTVSIGIAKLDAEKYSLKEIISFSDNALYTAKSEGKNRVVQY